MDGEMIEQSFLYILIILLLILWYILWRRYQENDGLTKLDSMLIVWLIITLAMIMYNGYQMENAFWIQHFILFWIEANLVIIFGDRYLNQCGSFVSILDYILFVAILIVFIICIYIVRVRG